MPGSHLVDVQRARVLDRQHRKCGSRSISGTIATKQVWSRGAPQQARGERKRAVRNAE